MGNSGSLHKDSFLFKQTGEEIQKILSEAESSERYTKTEKKSVAKIDGIEDDVQGLMNDINSVKDTLSATTDIIFKDKDTYALKKNFFTTDKSYLLPVDKYYKQISNIFEIDNTQVSIISEENKQSEATIAIGNESVLYHVTADNLVYLNLTHDSTALTNGLEYVIHCDNSAGVQISTANMLIMDSLGKNISTETFMVQPRSCIAFLYEDGAFKLYEQSIVAISDGLHTVRFPSFAEDTSFGDMIFHNADEFEQGISLTHEWDGTTLTVTSASGKSSANLKGEQGYSPEIITEQHATGATIGLKDENGVVHAVTLKNGKDGTSPTILPIADTEGRTGVSVGGVEIWSGLDGKHGYTPVMGVDYWTDEEQAKIKADNVAFIISELAKRGQVKTEFANSINECTDTTKLYVLPDGYIYAYMKKTEMKNPINQIECSQNADGSQYYGTNGEKGYKPGYRISSSSGTETAAGSYACTGFIPCTATDIIRTKNVSFNAQTNSNLTFFDENYTHLGYINGNNANDDLFSIVNSDGNIEGAICDATCSTITEEEMSKIRYIRISALAFSITPDDGNTGNDAIITINEPIESYVVTEEVWHNTEIYFVAGKYDDDIVDLKERISILEAGGTEDVKSYVQEEAQRVAANVYSHQNANTFTFMAISDAHYLAADSNIVTGNIHAGQGMDLVRKHVNVDFAVCLGDNGCGSSVVGSEHRATIEKGLAEIRALNSCIDSAFRDIPNFRSVGNHDSLVYNYTFNNNDYLDASELFPLYGAYNRGAIFQNGEKERGYCYRDFDDWKLRVICMNTSDIQDLEINDKTRPICVSATQGQWFAETLDMSAKSDVAEWSILILSHAPLDWGKACIYLCDILKAYVEGGTCNAVTHDGVTITYDYAGKNAATIIGNLHGHNHNFKVDYLRKLVDGSTTTTEPITVQRFCIPNACFERTNERGENGLESGSDGVFDIEYGEAISYEKTAGTAKDTAFCVVTIDTAARKIYAHAYGAGYDRVIDY